MAIVYSRETGQFEKIIESHPRRLVEGRTTDDGGLMLEEGDVETLSAVEVKRLLAAALDDSEESEFSCYVSTLPAGYCDVDGPVTPERLTLRGHELLLVVETVVLDEESPDDEEMQRKVSKVVERFAETHRSALRSLSVENLYPSINEYLITATVAPSWRGKSARELLRLGEGLNALMRSLHGGHLDREGLLVLLRSGVPEALVGLEENNWMDAKSQEYDLRDLKGKISLAEAVARFANAEDGGLIVFGAKAKKHLDVETVREVKGVPLAGRMGKARYIRVLSEILYPPPLGLEVFEVDIGEGMALVVVHLPPQDAAMKPFLVCGAILPDGIVRGSYISIVQRRGEESIPITAPMIHARLAAGQALLRGDFRRALAAAFTEPLNE